MNGLKKLIYFEADPNKRFEILKDVFGIEKYEVAIRNIKVVSDSLKHDITKFTVKLSQFSVPVHT